MEEVPKTIQEDPDPAYVPAAQHDAVKAELADALRRLDEINESTKPGHGPLSTRLARVLGAVERVAKTGKAPEKMGGFKFAREPDVYNAVRAHLAEEGIAVIPRFHDCELREAGKNQYGTTAWLVWGMCDVEYRAGHEVITASVPTYALDYGDKGAQKATSNAVKYAILKTFLIATGEDDAEQHDVEVRSGAPAALNGKASSDVQVVIKLNQAVNSVTQGYLNFMRATEQPDGTWLATIPRKRFEALQSCEWATVTQKGA